MRSVGGAKVVWHYLLNISCTVLLFDTPSLAYNYRTAVYSNLYSDDASRAMSKVHESYTFADGLHQVNNLLPNAGHSFIHSFLYYSNDSHCTAHVRFV
jgi:hypothetical protein